MPASPSFASCFGVAIALLVAAAASAHVAHERPRLQEAEEARNVVVRTQGANVTFELLRKSDPPTDYVRHVLDAKRGVVSSEYRPQASDADRAFHARWSLARIVEYRDQNGDGVFVPGQEPMVRSWSPTTYQWTLAGPQTARVAGVEAKLVRLQGNASGAPQLQVQGVAAGVAFVDEGATVREQDLAIYLDLVSFPRRGTGNLHALEFVVHATPGATVRLVETANVTVGVAVEAERRLALLDWGGEAMIDGVESRLLATLDPPSPDGSVAFRIHLPRLDDSARFLMVTAVEYGKENPRESPAIGVAGVALALAGLALARRRVTRRG